MRRYFVPLGEVNILEESFKNYKKNIEGLPLNEIYLKKINELGYINMITTNKNLGNYKYAGIIANEIICLFDAPEAFSASIGPLLTCSISSA